jgi:dTMP kinase
LRGLGHAVVTCADPGGTPLGDHLRAVVLGHSIPITRRAEAFLFLTSRAELVESVIRPALYRGEIVLSDRFTLATVVYQGHAGGLDSAALWQAAAVATGGLEPELTLVLDLPADVAAGRRRSADRVESRPPDYHERVREGFRAEARRRPESVRLIDASGSVDQVQQLIRLEVQTLLDRYAGV